MKIIQWVLAILATALVISLSDPLQANANGRDCTYAQGYWKTHSVYGPATPDDPYWGSFPDAAFFISGQTWLDVIRTPPRGNAYYILAKQFIAAQLNVNAGATTPPEVRDALIISQNHFLTCSPGDVSRDDPDCDRHGFLALASILSDYNEGYIGPGACMDCPCFDGIADDTPYSVYAISSATPCPPGSPSDTQFGGVHHFEFVTYYDVAVHIAGFCNGTYQYSCDGGPAGDFTLSAWQYEQCVAGPGWPPTIPD